jgi:superfamily II DNA or RNA helicase
MTTPHPLSLARRRLQDGGKGQLLLMPLVEVATYVLPFSRRAARLLERLGLERPSLRLATLVAELSAPGHKGVPAALVDKLGDALLAFADADVRVAGLGVRAEVAAARAGATTSTRLPSDAPSAIRRVYEAVLDLQRRTRALDESAVARPRIARLTLEPSPPAFFYTEGRGLDAVPSGLSVPLDGLDGARPLTFVPVRGPMLDVSSRLYAIERILDVVLEPVADEGERLAAMLTRARVVRVALLPGGGLRVHLPVGHSDNLASVGMDLAAALGLEPDDVDGKPGAYVVHRPARASDLLARLATMDDVVVAWTSVERVKLRRASAKDLRVRFGQAIDWLDRSSGLTLDDGSLVRLEEVLAALREGRRYVLLGPGEIGRQVGGTLVALQDALVEALVPLAVLGPGADANVAALAPAVEAVDGLAKDGATVEGAGPWRARLEAARDVVGEAPAALRTTLRPYQQEGLRFLRRLAAWGTGGVLADDMGLGKTVMALAFLLDRSALGPALVVAPTSVAFAWRDAAARFAPDLRLVSYAGPRRKAQLESLDAAAPGTVVVASWALVQRDVAALERHRFATLILDEAQAIKNATTATAKAARRLRADLRVGLTGTPLENHTGELWALLDVVAPGAFGTWPQFKARFATPIEKDGDARRRRVLARAIAPFVLRRKKADVLPELPPRIELVRRLDLLPAERQAYETTRQAVLVDLLEHEERRHDGPPTGFPRGGTGGKGQGQERVKILAALTRLRLVACHPIFAEAVLPPPATIEPASKQRAAVEALLELKASGHRALVFSQFVRHLEIARAAADAAGLVTLQLDGSTPADERERLVRAFQAGEADAFFLSLKAGGTGLTLTRASYVVHLDPWWNPAVLDQASDRAHRIGQTEAVTIVRLVAADTLEEDMLELHERKRALVEGVLHGTDAGAAASIDELLSILKHTRRKSDDDIQEVALPPAEDAR